MNMNNFQPMMPNQLNDNLNRNEMINNLINQNSQMTNQIAINNNMLQNLLNSEMSLKENKKNNFLSLLSEINFFPRYKGEIANIIFEDNTGIKINISAPNDAKMKDLLVIFYIKLQIYRLNHQINLDEMKDYIFLFNSQKISLDEEKSILDYGLTHKINKILFF